MKTHNNSSKTLRLDKWLWAVRIFKTRSQASEACKKGAIKIRGQRVKPSYALKKNDDIHVRKQGIIYTYRVLDLLEKRVNAKLALDYCLDITSPDMLQQKQWSSSAPIARRERGSGRPTKKERRKIDQLKT